MAADSEGIQLGDEVRRDSNEEEEGEMLLESVSAVQSFAELGLCDEVVAATQSLGWKSPTEIQIEAIPFALNGRDIIALAETGSGKTAAFALPILQHLLNDQRRLYALILSPTRELCVQIAEQFIALGSAISLEVATLVGGLDLVTQALALAKKPHIVVASPGRLVDHLQNTKGFDLRSIKFLVMDEADRLLSMDFDEALDKLLQVLPRARQTMLFSATMTSKVSKLQRASLKNPVKLKINSKYSTVRELVQHYILVPFKYKWTHAVALLKHFNAYSAMVFCNTCAAARKLAIFLRHLGFLSVCLHGKMTQPQRLGALNSFKAGQKKILVVTEVGSRGLDIPQVDLVLNFDVPLSSKDYIHRVGRTARAGRSGRAITIVTQYDVEAFQRVEFAIDTKLPEFTDVNESTALVHHESALDALRTAEMEVKEAGQEKLVYRRKKIKNAAHPAAFKKKRKSAKM